LVILGSIVFHPEPASVQKVGYPKLGVFTLLIILFIYAEFPDSLELQERERRAIAQHRLRRTAASQRKIVCILTSLGLLAALLVCQQISWPKDERTAKVLNHNNIASTQNEPLEDDVSEKQDHSSLPTPQTSTSTTTSKPNHSQHRATGHTKTKTTAEKLDIAMDIGIFFLNKQRQPQQATAITRQSTTHPPATSWKAFLCGMPKCREPFFRHRSWRYS
jgi:hypothetical protein